MFVVAGRGELGVQSVPPAGLRSVGIPLRGFPAVGRLRVLRRLRLLDVSVSGIVTQRRERGLGVLSLFYLFCVHVGRKTMRRYAGLCGFWDVVITGLVIGLAVFNTGFGGRQSEARADFFGTCSGALVPCAPSCPYAATGLTCTVGATVPTVRSTCPGCAGGCNQNLDRACAGTRPKIVDDGTTVACVCYVTGCI